MSVDRGSSLHPWAVLLGVLALILAGIPATANARAQPSRNHADARHVAALGGAARRRTVCVNGSVKRVRSSHRRRIASVTRCVRRSARRRTTAVRHASSPAPGSAPRETPIVAAAAPPAALTIGPAPVLGEVTSQPPTEEPVTTEAPPAEAPGPFRFFSGSSFWNAPVPADTPLDPSSASIVAHFDHVVATEVAAGTGPWMNTTEWSVPILTVPGDQPTVPVTLREHTESPALSEAWSAVPLPATAQPAAGSDKTLVIWQPDTDRLWEFHHLSREGGHWYAQWGGAIEDVSSNEGVFSPGAWPGAQTWWGASASSLSLVGGLTTLEDLASGEINHALDIAIPDVRAGLYASPAQRTDGKSKEALALPEGARLRLNPAVDLEALDLPPLTLALAKAAQRYGIFVSDYSSIVEFFGQDPTPTGVNPYAGPYGYFEGVTPTKLLAGFPWADLQLLPMELHGKASS
jgi:hypothetical protein